MTGGISDGEFQDYLGLLGRLLRLRTAQRTAIEEELRAHMEERFAALSSQGIEPERAVSMALAEFGDAAALAAEFTAISRLQKRRWMMRFTVGSIAATILLSAVVVSIWPDSPGELASSTALAQQVDKPAPSKPEKSAATQDANEQTQAQLEKHVDADFDESGIGPNKDDRLANGAQLDAVLEHLADVAKVQIYIDRRALADVNIIPDKAPVTMHLKDVPVEMVLRLVLRQYGLAYLLDNGVVIVTTPEEMESNLEIRVYAVADLMQEGDQHGAEATGPGGAPGRSPYAGYGGPRAPGAVVGSLGARNQVIELVDLITSTVEPASWDEVGGPARIRAYRGTLVVAQTYQAHRKVEKLLNDLRQAVQKQPVAKAAETPPGAYVPAP